VTEDRVSIPGRDNISSCLCHRVHIGSGHSLISALGGCEWLASRPGHFTPRERASGVHWIRGWGGAAVKRKIPSPYQDSNSRSSQRYTTKLSWFLYKSDGINKLRMGYLKKTRSCGFPASFHKASWLLV